jgi:hypothetical protein
MFDFLRGTIARSFVLRSVGIVGAVTVAATTSCSSNFHENYYVGVWEQRREANTTQAGHGDYATLKPAQFYRFRLDGWASLFSTTRFESGWFDANAVERLFGEVSANPPNTVVSNQQPSSNRSPTPIATIVTSGSASNQDPITLENIDIELGPASRDIAFTSATPSFTSLEHANLRATYTPMQGKTPASITSLEITGSADALADSKMLKEQSEIFADIVPAAGDSQLVVKSVDKLLVRGATLDLNAKDATPSGAGWTGTNVRAVSYSKYHSFAINAGTFNIIGGDTSGTPNQLRAVNAISTFDKVKSIEASAGFMLEVSNATIAKPDEKDVWRAHFKPANGIRLMVFGPSDKIAYKTDYNIQGGNAPDLDEALKKPSTSTEPISFDLHDVSLTLLSQVNVKSVSINAKPSGADSASSPPAVRPDGWTLTQAKINAGAFELTSAYAVEAAYASHEPTLLSLGNGFLIFGPEGEAPAQHSNQRLVVFMTANPKVLTDRLRAMVNSQQTQQVFGQMIFGHTMAQQATTTSRATRTLAQAKKSAADLTNALSSQSLKTLKGEDLRAILEQWSANIEEAQ